MAGQINGINQPNTSLEEVYVLALGAGKGAWTWQYSPSGLVNKRWHGSYYQGLAIFGYSSALAVYHHLDPITAISMELVTVEELKGHYPDGFIALLQMLKP